MAELHFTMVVEPKEDETPDGVQPTTPTAQEMLPYLNDHLNDMTKHDGMLGYRIMRVIADE